MVGFSSFCNGCVGAQIAVVKQLIGRSGTLAVTMLSVESLAVRGALLLAAQDNTGAIHELETTEKLLTIPVDHDLLPAASAPSVAPQAVAQGEQPELNFAAAHVPLWLDRRTGKAITRAGEDLDAIRVRMGAGLRPEARFW